VAAQQTDGFANLDFSHNRLLDRPPFQAVAQIPVRWQFDPQTSPPGGIDASPGLQTMAKMKVTTLKIPTHGLAGAFALRLPEMDHGLLH